MEHRGKLAVALAALALVAGVVLYAYKRWELATGELVEGEVCRYDGQVVDRDEVLYPVACGTSADGQPLEVIYQDAVDIGADLGDWMPPIGSRVELLHPAGRPGEARVIHVVDYWGMPLAVLAIALSMLLGLFGAWRPAPSGLQGRSRAALRGAAATAGAAVLALLVLSIHPMQWPGAHRYPLPAVLFAVAFAAVGLEYVFVDEAPGCPERGVARRVRQRHGTKETHLQTPPTLVELVDSRDRSDGQRHVWDPSEGGARHRVPLLRRMRAPVVARLELHRRVLRQMHPAVMLAWLDPDALQITLQQRRQPFEMLDRDGRPLGALDAFDAGRDRSFETAARPEAPGDGGRAHPKQCWKYPHDARPSGRRTAASVPHAEPPHHRHPGSRLWSG